MERVLTVGGNKASRPVTDFLVNVSTEFYVGPNAQGAGDDGRAGRSKETSLATIEAAIAKCTASKNDIIYLLPGHTETVATAGAIALDKIGIRVIGLGTGALRPILTFSAVDATLLLNAASTSIENVIIKPSIDSVVSPIVVSAADCKVDVEIQDASAAVECVAGILATAGADRLKINLKYIGFVTGNALVSAIQLVGVNDADINVDFYGIASTSIVDMLTTACTDIKVKGTFYNSGTTDLSKNVTATIGSCTWSVEGFDAAAGAEFSGGSGNAIAAGDLSAIAAAVAVIDEFHDVAAKNNVLNAQINEVIGNKTDDAATGMVTETDTLVGYIKQLVGAGISRDAVIGALASAAATGAVTDTDTLMAYIKQLVTEGIARDAVIGAVDTAAATGAVTDTDKLMAYIKQLVTELQVVDGLHDVPPVDAVTDATMRDVVGKKNDAAVVTVGTEKSLMAYLKGALNTALKIDSAALGTVVAGSLAAAIPRCVEKANGSVENATTDDLFVVSGGPVRAKIVGLVSTVIGGAANMSLQHTTTDPAATVDLNAAPVAIDADAAGTIYTMVGNTGVFTPSTGLGFKIGDPVTVEEVEYILAPGTVKALGSAAQTGVIKWYMSYVPLSPNSLVVAAA